MAADRPAHSSMLWFAVARRVWKIEDWSQQLFDPSPHKLGNLYIKGVLLFDMTRQHFIKLTHLLVFPQLRNVYETVFDQLLQQQSYENDYSTQCPTF